MSESRRSSISSTWSEDNQTPCVRYSLRRATPFRMLKYAGIFVLGLALVFLLSIRTPVSSKVLPTRIPAPTSIPASHTASPSSQVFPRIGKVTASFGPKDPVYEAAIASHQVHNDLHGYPQFILHERMLPGLWSKHAFLLTILGAELAKPAAERLEWLFWHDRDTILMNPKVPLQVFLPPVQDVHLVVTNDRHGLNNGVFFIRVNEWAIRFFAAALSLKEYNPDIQLKYSEQSAMEEVSMRQYFSSAVAHVPQRWFNGFPPNPAHPDKPSLARPASLLIHFASNRDGKRPERMAYWAGVARSKGDEWIKPLNETGYPAELEEYWAKIGNGEDVESLCKEIGARVWT
ncbi:hypothetical protein AA0119_g5752 [Alternaria tenuissima]|uniref:Galactosyl transferase GMA12/MNN10 family protein n=2 Tax=Alternaria alternata complex TaxID=187734 RepID=A0A4Q4NJR4_ALTAL|nr:hypothetical protein AA0115_g7884 [Alternaria tenuissima]RYN49057.1 hypothetical protein AA0114_g6650 [Alternaria tenuissima]RYN76872.1 hypothetical protein AA0117_g5134 [Alternaria alternata]RYO00866.1 hypothetical protein AA0119_g5752 [Alternaria tenuissima]RYO14599.1 hypothetical protein AA0121_g7656 [Alternaria tenuissima]